jgi:threonine 3-dehydrogenase
MLSIVKNEPKKGVTLQESPKPIPQPDEVLIRVKISGICGSDLSIYKVDAPLSGGNLILPRIIGHEFCGVVEEVGAKVTNFESGDRVAGETHIPCMKCLTCQTGGAHICPNQRNVGRNVNGSFAEYITVSEVSVRKVPEALTDYQVAMLEPLGVAVHSVRQKDLAAENVLVLGCGPLGLMTVAVARAFGASRVFATSRTPEKLDKALKMGADKVFQASDKDIIEKIESAAGPTGVGTAIDMSGNEEAIEQGLRALSPGGTMILAGIPDDDIRLDVLSYSIYKEIKLVGVYGRTMWETWLLSEMLFEQGRVDTEPLTGSTYSPEDYGKAFQEAAEGKFGRTFFRFSD